MPRPKFAKGNSGRPKGTPNKATAEVKEMLRQALSEVGGVAYLVQRAQDEKTAGAFLALVGKLIPNEVKAELSGGANITLTIERSFVRGTEEKT